MTGQRPSLTDPDWLQDARKAVDNFVAELQLGIDSSDAVVYNGHFEMALYVLVRRDGQWWLAAGHNTFIRPKP